MPFKANIVHKRVASAQLGAVQVSLPAAPSFLFLRDVGIVHIIPYSAVDHATNWNDERMPEKTS